VRGDQVAAPSFTDFTAICTLSAGIDFDRSAASGPREVSATVELTLLHTFGSPGRVSLACLDAAVDPAEWAHLRIAAIQVSSITNS
jgi:hypothetical protein